MFVGMELGSLEGVIVGSDDGFTDGTVVVGVSVGANDEVQNGARLGRLDGLHVGRLDGTIVGARLGSSVRDLVG